MENSFLVKPKRLNILFGYTPVHHCCLQWLCLTNYNTSRDICVCVFMCVLAVQECARCVSIPAGPSCGGPSHSLGLRRDDLSTLGSGISTNLSFVLLQNGLFCVPFSAGHCEECFLVSALIHTVTQATIPLNYPPYLPGIHLFLGELRLHYLPPITAPRG